METRGISRRTWVHLIPSWITVVLLGISYWMPFWHSTMKAPQYPEGLFLNVYQDHVEGDIEEINTLNHYVGLRSIEKVAVVERKLAPFALMFCMLHLIYLPFVKNYLLRCLFILPTIVYPLVAMIDLNAWLKWLGHNMDPEAPLNMTVKPFTAPLVGSYEVANFHVISQFDKGAWLLFAASGMAVVGLLVHLVVWVRGFKKSRAHEVAARTS